MRKSNLKKNTLLLLAIACCTLALLQKQLLVQGKIFDSFVSYRQGSNALYEDTSTWQNVDEPDVADSVEAQFAYTTSDPEKGTIDVVHCYSMKNGLYGSRTEARIFWTRLDFTNADYHRSGEAQNIRAVTVPIETPISQFAVYETDMSAFLMAQTRRLQIILHIVPGPNVSDRELRTLTFLPSIRIPFTISEFVLLPQANKAIFYSNKHLGEIDLTHYPFVDTDDWENRPGIKIHKVFNIKAEEGNNPDDSAAGELMHLQPVYYDDKWSGQLVLLMTNVEESRTTLRLDVVSALQIQGTAVNIARINTGAEAAYNTAKFSEISYQGDDTTHTHFFATIAYQSYPFEANFLTISEACSEDGIWEVDRSQAFQVSKESLGNIYLKVLGIRKNPVPVGDGSKDQVIEFTIYMAGFDNLYKFEFAVAQYNGVTPNQIALRRADVYKSVEFNFNQALSRVAFQPAHVQKQNSNWPEFYLFVTGSRQLTLTELEISGKKQRMQDGLLLSEDYFRTQVKGLELMQEKKSIIDEFQKSGELVEDVTYSDSRVLPSNEQRISGIARTTIFDDTMRFDKSFSLVDKSEVKDYFGNNWPKNTEECALVEINYDNLPSFGFTDTELVSYLDVQESSKVNIFDNEMVITESEKGGFQINNNIENLVKESLQSRCSGDIFCGATVSLCFGETSKIFLCNEEESESAKVYAPTQDNVIKEQALVGETFHMAIRKENQCYIAATTFDRIDNTYSLADNYENSKRIVIADPGEKPFLDVDPPLEWYLGAGQAFEIPFSSFTDPEDKYVFFMVNFRTALKFARYDYEQQKIIIDKRTTTVEDDAGEYPITVSLIERINKSQMPARTYELKLTVGPVIPPVPLPSLKSSPEGVKLPKMEIKEFMPYGTMKITVSKPLEFPSDLMQRNNDIRQNPVPLYGESDEIGYIRNMMKIDIVVGDGNDLDQLGYDFNITAIQPTEIDVKFTFENPLAFSQGEIAEGLFVTINMEQYTDPDGLSLGRNYNMTTFITRQIPDQEETASKLQAAGIALTVLGTIAIIVHFVSCIILGASLNQLWTTFNGLQLAVHMPLYFTRFPANANYFLYPLIDFATFDIFPRNSVNTFFDLPVSDSFNVNFQASRYESMYLVGNARTCILLIVLFILQCMVWVVLQIFKDKCKCAKVTFDRYSSLLYWSVLIRLFLEMFMELAVSAFVNMSAMQFESDDSSVLFNNFFTILVTMILFAMPIFIWSFFACHIDHMDEEEFEENFGEFYSGLMLDKTRGRRFRVLFYPFWFVMRRLVFAFTITVAQDQLWLQFSFAFLFSIVNLCYVLKFKPFTDKTIFWLEILNEATNLILLYHTMLFTNLMLSEGDRYDLGWSFIGFFSASFAVHIVMLIYTIVVTSRYTYRKKKYHKVRKESGAIEREEKQLEQLKARLSVIKEDEFESNHSEKNSNEKRKQNKVSDSDWDSRLGHTEKGYDMKAIRWKDLGRKYIIKQGRKNMLADLDISVVEGQFHTIDDRYIDVNIKMHLDLGEQSIGQSLSARKLHKRNSSVEHQEKAIEDGQKNRLGSSNESSPNQIKSQLIVYQNIGVKDLQQPVIETERSGGIEDTARQLVMINTCLNVNKIMPQNPTTRYAKMAAGEEPSSSESCSERHDTIDEPVQYEKSIQDDYEGNDDPQYQEKGADIVANINILLTNQVDDQRQGNATAQPVLSQDDEQLVDGLLEKDKANAGFFSERDANQPVLQ